MAWERNTVNVATLILQLQAMAQPTDTVTLIVEDGFGECMSGVFTGLVIGARNGAEAGKCEIYGIE